MCSGVCCRLSLTSRGELSVLRTAFSVQKRQRREAGRLRTGQLRTGQLRTGQRKPASPRDSRQWLESFPEEIFREEEHVGGTFGEAAHEVGIPFFAVGDVDADFISVRDERSLQIAANAVEHLKFETGGVDSLSAGEVLCCLDHGGVVGGDAMKDATFQQGPGESDEVAVDVFLIGEGEVGRFLISAFAETDTDAIAEQGRHVGRAASQVGLNDDADVAAVGGFGVKGADQVDGGLGVSGTFHIDAHEGIGLNGVVDEAGDGFRSEFRAEVHAHLSQLEADIGVEPGLGQRVEDPVIALSCLAGLVGNGDVFAEAVEGDGEALGAEDGGGAEAVLNTEAGDKAGGHAPPKSGGFGEPAHAGILREGDECRTQEGHFIPA